MSRCFPFPPPGYEKKIIVDDVDLLTKEKRKEKKHKKDKKDKERKEGKDKKDKEKNKEKHKEKKERKEKHRDKKEKDKDKHKKDKDRNENKREGLDEKRVEGLPDFHNGRKIAEDHQRSVDIKDSKFVQDLARRNRNEGGPTGSHMVQSVSITNDDRDSIPRRKVENHIGNFPAENEKNGKKNVGRRINGQEIRINVQGVGGPVDNHISAGHQKRMDASTVPMGKKHVENRVEGKWKNEPKEYDNKAANPGNKDQEKKRKEKDKEKEKEQEKEKVKERYAAIKGQPRLKDSHKNPLQNCKVKPSDISKDGGKTSIGDSNLGKRKEVEKNGYTHDNNSQPHKMPRHVSSPHPGTENGRKLEPWQATHAVSEKLLQSANGKLSTKDVRLNDFVAPPKPNISLKMPSPTGVRVDENGETSKRPLHPDAQYLSQILSVPKVEELADIENDDQEWLFSGKRPHEERPKLQTAETGSQQVWDKAIQIEDVDLVVLPYVIPY